MKILMGGMVLVVAAVFTNGCSDNGKPKEGGPSNQVHKIWAKENCSGTKKATSIYNSWVSVDTDLKLAKVEEFNFRKGHRRAGDRMVVSVHCKSSLSNTYESISKQVWIDVHDDTVDIDPVPLIEIDVDGRVCRKVPRGETTVQYSFKGKCLVIEGEDGSSTTFMPADDFWDLVFDSNGNQNGNFGAL